MLDDIRLFLMLFILESNQLYCALKGIPSVRWVVELWCENIRGYQVMVTDGGIAFYRLDDRSAPAVEDSALDT